MLIIRQEQLARFEDAARERFLHRLAEYLQYCCPSLSPVDARSQAQLALDAARSMAIEAEDAVAEFSRIIAVHCGGFPLRALPDPAMATLTATEVPAWDRVRRFGRWFRPEPEAN